MAAIAVIFALVMGLGNAADFGVFYKTALDLRTLGWASVYDVHGITPYHYHPFTALLFLPSTYLTFPLAKWVWAILNGWWLWDSYRLAKQHFKVADGPVLLGLAFCVYPLTWQMKFGNTSVFLAWAVLIALTTRRQWLGDALLALLILIKLTLVGWLPLLLLTGHSRRAGRMLIWIGGASLFAWLLAGSSTYESWWLTLNDPLTAHNYSKNDNQSWYALTYRYKTLWNMNAVFLTGTAVFGLVYLKQLWPLRRREDVVLVTAALPWLWCGPLSWIHHQILLWPVFVGALAPLTPKPWTSRHTVLVVVWLLLNGITSLFLGSPLSLTAHEWGVPLLGFALLLSTIRP